MTFKGLFAAAALAAVFILGIANLKAQEIRLPSEAERQEWLKWIPESCCITNNCCFEVPASALRPLPKDQWQVVATGQTLNRTDWSQAGKYIRCACDAMNGKWVVHREAHTRCVFPLMNLTRR